VELPGGLGGLVQRGGFGQTFFFGAEVLGVTLKTPQGRTVQAGGRVVKNVQGYDLVRPFVGSFGALGEAVSVTLRLRPGRTSVFLQKPLEPGFAWSSAAAPQPRFLWQHKSTLLAFHFGHPKEVERLRQAFGGEIVDNPVDYSGLFPNGMGVGPGPLRDLRFTWADGGAKPPLPAVFQRLASVL
jgi:FAD/FMN-containing dehydrogenase